MAFASIISADYKIALFLHVLAVVLAFGPTFGYGILYSVCRSSRARRRRSSLASRRPTATWSTRA